MEQTLYSTAKTTKQDQTVGEQKKRTGQKLDLVYLMES